MTQTANIYKQTTELIKFYNTENVNKKNMLQST